MPGSIGKEVNMATFFCQPLMIAPGLLEFGLVTVPVLFV